APSEFDEGLRNRGAIYIPFAQAIPNVPVIDREQCLKFTTGKCGICAKICPAGAIEYEQEDEIITQNYGAIVLATGFETLDLAKFGELGYDRCQDVVTSLEFERLTNAAGPTNGHLERLSDGKVPRKIVFVSCVGSRDTSKRGKTYCSKICCMYTAKHAMLVKEKYPQIDVTVFYIDVRTPGKGFDEFQRRAVEEYGVHYIRGQVGKVVDEGEALLVFASDLTSGEHLCLSTDMVVLATAVTPATDARKLATMLTASIDTNDFYTEAHPKLRPVESPTAGIFLAGMCQGPKDIPETVAQAGAAAVKVLGLLSKDQLLTNPCVAHCDEAICSGCQACSKVCPYGAITYVEKEVITLSGKREQRTVASVNDALCQGCGACTVACPSGTMDLRGFSNKQIIAEVDAIC
ncbi:MAG: CoB--CoM heterodisulfide reductase iron-sulfur subunit A family protein, partial [Acidaminococcaceae bacterium]